ncbi:MAG: LPS assembly protein LptD [Sphingomicrobium sp.]
MGQELAGHSGLKRKFAWWSALPMLLVLAEPAHGQEAVASDPLAPVPPLPGAAAAGERIEFTADQVAYDNNGETVTASGRVRLNRDGNFLAADEVRWDRKSGQVTAHGNVVLVDPQGDKIVSDNVALSDSLRDGTVENLLIVLENGARIAARRATRANDVTTLENAIYSPCPVATPNGCPKRPSWAIVAARVIDDPAAKKIRFEGGRLQLFGIELPLIPLFAIAQGKGGASGWMVPNFSYSSRKGFEIAAPYHWQLGPNRDLTITPHAYTAVLPAIEGKYRELNRLGAYQIGGFFTYGRIEDADNDTIDEGSRKDFRAYVEGNGKWQLDPNWSVTSAIRVATDKTVTRRYDLTNDDRLRNFVNAERITPDSYVTIAGWAFQGLRVDDRQRSMPIALPAIDARFRFANVAGGTVEVEGNSLAILRLDGQDTQRAFASARWDMRRLTGLGQEVTLTGLVRGDVYHTVDAIETLIPSYRGRDGWHSRRIAALAADVQWPFSGPLLGGFQRLTPRLQLVITPKTNNVDIPNEDSRSVDLEDSNLFALNRFPGYDRWEDQSRVTYGVDWTLERPNLTLTTNVGQSYRMVERESVFPDGTGLTGRFSDIVGRTRLRYGRFIDLSHRFRLDKNNFDVRRNEVDLTIGSDQTYAQLGYLKLNRNVDASIEDLRDKEELRFAARVLFARYWSVFGSTVIDLTDKREDPLSLADGFQLVRDRIGLLYADECLEIGLTYRRDHERIGTFRNGTTFSLHLALKGVSR